MKDPNLEDVLDKAWALLTQRKEEAGDRTIVLSTVSTSAQPQACLVVLRAVDRQAALLEFHTDADSLKCQSLKANPNAQVLLWYPNQAIQLRIDVRVTLYQSFAAQEKWQKVPEPSRVAYGKSPPTGDPITAPFAYHTLSVAKKFTLARCDVQKMDVLCLEGRHWRAKFMRKEEWSGQWLSP